jgi:putative ABC transport system permease protein
VKESINRISKLYSDMFPGNPFEYYFLDDFFNKQYQADRQFGTLMSAFSLFAILIACLGLWGLASFTTNQRTKEISIRKVLGASVGNIASLLSGQLIKLLVLASILAWPITWYLSNLWLSNFAFRTGFSWGLYVVPSVILFVIALSAVSVIIIKGAKISPVKALLS